MWLRTALGEFINADQVIRIKRVRPKEGDDRVETERSYGAKMTDGSTAVLDDYYIAPGRLEEALGVIPRDDRRREAKR